MKTLSIRSSLLALLLVPCALGTASANGAAFASQLTHSAQQRISADQRTQTAAAVSRDLHYLRPIIHRGANAGYNMTEVAHRLSLDTIHALEKQGFAVQPQGGATRITWPNR